MRDAVQKDLESFREASGWTIFVDFVAIDKRALDTVIYGTSHGYIPYTGKKTLKLENGEWMEMRWEDTNVLSVVCTVKLDELLRWFSNSRQVNRFLQKNVREFLGEKDINRAIAKSYRESPTWFWYKHNGIIIFADNLSIDRDRLELTLRNPQVVNGGQTLSALYLAFDKGGRKDSAARVLRANFSIAVRGYGDL